MPAKKAAKKPQEMPEKKTAKKRKDKKRIDSYIKGLAQVKSKSGARNRLIKIHLFQTYHNTTIQEGFTDEQIDKILKTRNPQGTMQCLFRDTSSSNSTLKILKNNRHTIQQITEMAHRGGCASLNSLVQIYVNKESKETLQKHFTPTQITTMARSRGAKKNLEAVIDFYKQKLNEKITTLKSGPKIEPEDVVKITSYEAGHINLKTLINYCGLNKDKDKKSIGDNDGTPLLTKDELISILASSGGHRSLTALIQYRKKYKDKDVSDLLKLTTPQLVLIASYDTGYASIEKLLQPNVRKALTELQTRLDKPDLISKIAASRDGAGALDAVMKYNDMNEADKIPLDDDAVAKIATRSSGAAKLFELITGKDNVKDLKEKYQDKTKTDNWAQPIIDIVARSDMTVGRAQYLLDNGLQLPEKKHKKAKRKRASSNKIFTQDNTETKAAQALLEMIKNENAQSPTPEVSDRKKYSVNKMISREKSSASKRPLDLFGKGIKKQKTGIAGMETLVDVVFSVC